MKRGIKLNSNTHTVECIDVNQAGIGVCLVDGKRVFVENLLPEEKAVIKITKIRSKFAQGVVVERLTDSPNRVTPLCPVPPALAPLPPVVGSEVPDLSSTGTLSRLTPELQPATSTAAANAKEIRWIIQKLLKF